MIAALRNLMRLRPRRTPPSTPPGERVYAVGDVHGQYDLFEALMDAIGTDDAARGDARTTTVLLGDLIDRGPQSAQVLASARERGGTGNLRILCGNHEEMFLRTFAEPDIFREFLRYGGHETLMSYLPDGAILDTLDVGEAHDLWCSAVPQLDIDFVTRFENSVTVGDYMFVHAGIRPGMPLEEQATADMRWIREPFLSSRQSHGPVIVHGHTIAPEVVIRPNRIGIDTGAYKSGRLTALGLEGTGRWLIEACESERGAIVETRELGRP